jgi:hypothetical protein
MDIKTVTSLKRICAPHCPAQEVRQRVAFVDEYELCIATGFFFACAQRKNHTLLPTVGTSHCDV